MIITEVEVAKVSVYMTAWTLEEYGILISNEKAMAMFIALLADFRNNDGLSEVLNAFEERFIIPADETRPSRE